MQLKRLSVYCTRNLNRDMAENLIGELSELNTLEELALQDVPADINFHPLGRLKDLTMLDLDAEDELELLDFVHTLPNLEELRARKISKSCQNSLKLHDRLARVVISCI